MSYDLAVFSPDVAPRERAAFMAWYLERMEWGEPHEVWGNPDSLRPELRAFYDRLIVAFPDMNGAAEIVDEEDPHLTDYSFADGFMYLGFSWDVAEDAYTAVRKIAEDAGVGFYDASGDGSIIFPGEPPVPETPGLLARLFGKRR